MERDSEGEFGVEPLKKTVGQSMDVFHRLLRSQLGPDRSQYKSLVLPLLVLWEAVKIGCQGKMAGMFILRFCFKLEQNWNRRFFFFLGDSFE